MAAGLRDRFGEEGVFLDTWVLNRRGDPQAGLEEGLDASAVVLVLIGRRWEGLEARRRESGERDKSGQFAATGLVFRIPRLTWFKIGGDCSRSSIG